jgi:hypothetical protein
MPDVSTHLMFGLALGLIVSLYRSREEAMLVVLGALLPDVERPLTWVLLITGYDVIHLTSATHSIMGALMLSFFASSCFNWKDVDFQARFKLILLGSTEHLILDLTMHPWAENGLYLFYPLKIPLSFGFVWSDYLWFPLYGIIALAVASIIFVILSKAFQRET